VCFVTKLLPGCYLGVTWRVQNAFLTARYSSPPFPHYHPEAPGFRVPRKHEKNQDPVGPDPMAQCGPGEVSKPRPVTADGGQDRALALGWGEGVHPIRPKTIARYDIIPHESYACFNPPRKEAGRV
jgi:hypothetical protein